MSFRTVETVGSQGQIQSTNGVKKKMTDLKNKKRLIFSFDIINTFIHCYFSGF